MYCGVSRNQLILFRTLNTFLFITKHDMLASVRTIKAKNPGFICNQGCIAMEMIRFTQKYQLKTIARSRKRLYSCGIDRGCSPTVTGPIR